MVDSISVTSPVRDGAPGRIRMARFERQRTVSSTKVLSGKFCNGGN